MFSHFVLDWVTHRPDLPLAPGSDTKFGLGLWNNLFAAIGVEAALFAAGIWLYLSATRARTWIGSAGFWLLIAVLLGAWLSGPFGPPPPSIEAVTISAIGAIPIILAWSWIIIDRRRGGVAR